MIPNEHRWKIAQATITTVGVVGAAILAVRPEFQEFWSSVWATGALVILSGSIYFKSRSGQAVRNSDSSGEQSDGNECGKDDSQEHYRREVNRGIPLPKIVDDAVIADLDSIRLAGQWIGHDDGSLEWMGDGITRTIQTKYGTLISVGDRQWNFVKDGGAFSSRAEVA